MRLSGRVRTTIAVAVAAGLLAQGIALGARPKKKSRGKEREVHVRCLDVAVRDGVTFSARTSELLVENLADPLAPEAVSRLGFTTTLADVELAGQTAYVAAGSHGLYVVDIADPAAPLRVSRFDTPGSARRVLPYGAYAILADGSGGLRVIDLSVPDRPRQAASFSSRSSVRSLALSGRTLATAEGTAGVRLFDMDEPRSPRLLAALQRTEGALDVAFLDDGRLVTALGRDGLRVFDVDSRGRVRSQTDVPARGGATHVIARGSRVFVSNGSAGVRIIDLSAGTAPKVIATVELPRAFPLGRLTLEGDRLYAAADVAGIAVIDITSLEAPVVLRPRAKTIQINRP